MLILFKFGNDCRKLFAPWLLISCSATSLMRLRSRNIGHRIVCNQGFSFGHYSARDAGHCLNHFSMVFCFCSSKCVIVEPHGKLVWDCRQGPASCCKAGKCDRRQVHVAGTWMIKRTIGNVDNGQLQTRSPAKRQTLAAPTASYPLGFDDYDFA